MGGSALYSVRVLKQRDGRYEPVLELERENAWTETVTEISYPEWNLLLTSRLLTAMMVWGDVLQVVVTVAEVRSGPVAC
ncbi:hypothetical protein MRX96_030158 [Rhipicephalus microplus]